MAERVRRFRVVNVEGCHGCGVKVGDVSTLVRTEHRTYGATQYSLVSLGHWRGNEYDGTHAFFDWQLEELPAFAVGDAVRVKAGSPVYRCDGYEKPPDWAFGHKMRYDGPSRIKAGYTAVFVHNAPGGETFCSDDYLEPWNDAEEWDGKAWVAKKPVESKTGLTFWEAVEHLRKHGGSCVHFPYSSLEIEWSEGHLRLSGDKQKVPVNTQFLDSEWRVAPKPAKQYSFFDAYAMMKQGKWMQMVSSDAKRVDIATFQNGKWLSKTGGMLWEHDTATFRSDQIDSGKWIEYTEPK